MEKADVRLAKELGELTALDFQGNHVRLGDFWRERPAILVFIRHFG